MALMQSTKNQKKTKKNLVSPSRWEPFHLSEKMVQNIFLSVTLLVTVVLYGACTSVANMPIVEVVQIDRNAHFEKNMRELVHGFPIEDMAPIIAKQNKTTAAFLVGIAKKESNWGKRVPRTENGEDCYNYWGYRGEGSRGIAMGHGCFGSPEEAIGIVGGRLDTLVHEYQFDTAEELVVWKCGWSCDGHSNVSVKKWIADVKYYYHKADN